MIVEVLITVIFVPALARMRRVQAARSGAEETRKHLYLQEFINR